ncbi:enoyl-CoA hydratase [Sphingobium sp. LB126]|uniref:crotonase/enoyl-CoA hydratase family protein n=1 Tax=Sphingobium sp. LB126 TaxID=1983755 RepID=UPI000C2041D4|nr:crotonase/enoyl-CoA hydratase family protein [Sphingobium sp. LB126]PJG47388.1 enoyl-CoA hydratase [Sphingobium sp. LB126]
MLNNRVNIVIDDGIADVRLARPDKMNAIDLPMFEEIASAIDRLAGETSLRVVVLSGEGRAFCAGLDMASVADGGSELDLATRSHGLANHVQQVAWGWRTLRVPVIAAVHGIAFGGGLQIASGADIVLARADTRFSVMEMKWGIIPDMGGFALWRGRVRDDVVRELTYTAREFDGVEGATLGFVSRTADDPHAEALALARTIAAQNPHAVRAAKRIANLAATANAGTILMAESIEQIKLLQSPNQIEAVQAHKEKRSPRFAD